MQLYIEMVRKAGDDFKVSDLTISYFSGNIAYIVNELSNTVTIYDLQASTESAALAEHTVLPTDAKAAGLCASAINLTEDGRHLYITNRLENHPDGDAVVWFSTSKDGRELQRQGELRTGLDHPRGAELFDAHGKSYYIVGSKTGRGAVVYERSKVDGDLTEAARNVDVVAPSGFALVWRNT